MDQNRGRTKVRGERTFRYFTGENTFSHIKTTPECQTPPIPATGTSHTSKTLSVFIEGSVNHLNRKY
jgi:hypothetical protein